MANPKPKKEAVPKVPRPEVKEEAGVQPVYALVKVTYGAGQCAPSKSIFTPVSENERNELLAIAAVRELDETEAKILAPTPAPAPAAEGTSETTSDEDVDTSTSDSDVIE